MPGAPPACRRNGEAKSAAAGALSSPQHPRHRHRRIRPPLLGVALRGKSVGYLTQAQPRPLLLQRQNARGQQGYRAWRFIATRRKKTNKDKASDGGGGENSPPAVFFSTPGPVGNRRPPHRGHAYGAKSGRYLPSPSRARRAARQTIATTLQSFMAKPRWCRSR